MPSTTHEALIELFRNRPELAAELLTEPLGIMVPRFEQARLDSGDLTDLAPTEYRADAVVVLTRNGTAVLAVIIEVQLARDKRKRRTWPVYLTTLHARLRCPAILLVLCADPDTAGWCAAPIHVGHPGWELRPLALGPDKVPVVTDVDDAPHAPELVVLSAMAHGTHPDRDKVFRALIAALEHVDEDHATLYHDVVLSVLPEAARHHLEALLLTRKYEYQSDFARKYFGQGKAEGEKAGRAEGEANALLAVLDAREIAVPEEAKSRITECTDLDQLDAWIRRAVTATRIEDVLD
ncbi:hypothetical protein [Haloechinothrix halophila]|uniref:hypothetical protein n=1 Tax=Haloechinothrix halophila TaxID=1069073 RepID=UPI00041046D7|nr:hypothetical protein [Haloechinothrix halophila]